MQFLNLLSLSLITKMTFKYLLFWMIIFLGFVWVVVRALKRSYLPPDSDDDGGMPVENNLPIFDPPSGDSLDDLLVDRPPKGYPRGFTDAPVRTRPERTRS